MAHGIRVGFVGARFAAEFHWDAMRRVYGVADRDGRRDFKDRGSTGHVRTRKRNRSFESFEELCAAVDVVDLCTPPSSHESLSIQALQLGKHVIIEKPLTGYYGSGVDSFRGDSYPKEQMLRESVASCGRILAAAKASGQAGLLRGELGLRPAIQKEREIVAKSGAQILWMLGEQSHSGSLSAYYGSWKFSGGGSLVGKGCHPVSAALYLKRVEGEARNGVPIRPTTVSARTHEITKLKSYRDEGYCEPHTTTLKITRRFTSSLPTGP